MARIDSRHPGTIIDAKRGQRPVRLISPHSGPHAAPVANEAEAKRTQRTRSRAAARQRFAAAYANAREKAKGAL